MNSTPYYPPAIHQRWLDTFLAHLPPTIRLLSPGPTAAAREAHERLGEMRSIRWIAYAARAFVIRFWHLISKADSADIFIMLIAYMLMHLTFLNTFRNMAKLGSTFWLGQYLHLLHTNMQKKKKKLN
jgi:hydroxymethylglutaryl-CoA reductase (NADPH)